jgi:hypothetical protein
MSMTALICSTSSEYLAVEKSSLSYKKMKPAAAASPKNSQAKTKFS